MTSSISNRPFACSYRPRQWGMLALRASMMLSLLLYSGSLLRSADKVRDVKAPPKVCADTDVVSTPGLRLNDLAMRRFVGELADFRGLLELPAICSWQELADKSYCESSPLLCSRLCHCAQHSVCGCLLF